MLPMLRLRGVFLGLLLAVSTRAAQLDVAPFGLPLPDGNGVMWEDPREIHRVVVGFTDTPPSPDHVRLEYWGSRWPEQRLPKDREPGGGDVGWMELGNWYKDGWRAADTDAQIEGHAIVFTFRPVNAKEFPQLKDYAARFRYTLKLRVAVDGPAAPPSAISALTDSTLQERTFQLAWEKPAQARVDAVFNGRVVRAESIRPLGGRYLVETAVNPDPNTFDRTLVTISRDRDVFTFAMDDLKGGPLLLPHLGVVVLPGGDQRDYAAVATETKSRGQKTLYDRVAELPEQTWRKAWDGMPPKKSRISFPLGLDGGRQRFRLRADGSVDFRANDSYLAARPGKDTPRLALEKPDMALRFGLSYEPSHRNLEEESLPVCETTWDQPGVRIDQTAFVTPLEGTQAVGPVPPADSTVVFMARFTFTNTTSEPRTVTLPLKLEAGELRPVVRVDPDGVVWNGDNFRGLIVSGTPGEWASDPGRIVVTLIPGQAKTMVLKIPYLVLTEPAERAALKRLDFDTERTAVAGYWRRRMDESSVLVTPEPMLNEFYRSHAMHLLVNCEREPGSDRRFARVGSFVYGVYGNESCMMVVDLDRRGYHREARECLDAWLHYQGTVELPGSFASRDGVLYGAGGYEAGGYNQHHGWILWMMAEHYRFTRDEPWLRGAAPGIVKACDWIIRETARTKDRPELERGLLPAGSLEDIGDWWTWLSTSCYTWRGLDSAAWALEQVHHPDAGRIRRAADDYHRALIANFTRAMERSPVVRLRDGTAVPQIPSQVHRRGRSFGWICQTLEGPMHLLITGAIAPRSELATWILNDYEDNLYLSNQYGYVLDDFERNWFGRGGMSMQACLLLDVEPYLHRDDVKQALRALFNAEAVSHFPDVRMNTEHALPEMGDWKGDIFKSSDEANVAGWLRYLFVREEDDTLLIGQAVPRGWLAQGQRCGIERAATYFGPMSVIYSGGENQITARLEGPRRNPPTRIRVRVREPRERSIQSVMVNGKPWTEFKGEWIELPGDIGDATIVARF
jgi:hypothetical protein